MPGVRIEPTQRWIRAMLEGWTVVDSRRVELVWEIDYGRRPGMLFETGFPARTYLPKADVRMELLRRSSTTSHCPYKGFAEYWSVEVDGTVHDDVVWGYQTPLTEALPVAGMVALFDEPVDVTVDGERVERPRTPFF